MNEEKKITWIIGDIHGMYDPLRALITRLDNKRLDKFVFVGDYIDHGPSSKEVLDLIIELGDKAVPLMGNHEYLLLLTLYNEDHRKKWGKRIWVEDNGGQQTIRSFGYADFEEFEAKIEPKYTNFLKSLKFFHQVALPGDEISQKFLITHAGVMPDIPIEEQLAVRTYLELDTFMEEKKVWIENAFIWIRDKFFNSDPDLWKDYIVIHGHSPTHLLHHIIRGLSRDEERVVPYLRTVPETERVISIDIDTGAAFGNCLTALGLTQQEIRWNSFRIPIRQLDIKTGYYQRSPIKSSMIEIEFEGQRLIEQREGGH